MVCLLLWHHRGEYRVVYITPEFIEADGCALLKQLHSKVGTLIIHKRHIICCYILFLVVYYLA